MQFVKMGSASSSIFEMTRKFRLHEDRNFAYALSCYDIYHVCGMDNLYNSVTFGKRAWNHKRKLKVHGVMIKGMMRIPGCVVQEEQK